MKVGVNRSSIFLYSSRMSWSVLMRFRDNGEHEMRLVCSETETEYQLLMMETQISRKSEMFRAASLYLAWGQLSLESTQLWWPEKLKPKYCDQIRPVEKYFDLLSWVRPLYFSLAARQNSFLLLHCRVSRAACQVYCPVRSERCGCHCTNNVRSIEDTLCYLDSFVGGEPHNGDQLVVFPSHHSSCSASPGHDKARSALYILKFDITTHHLHPSFSWLVRGTRSSTGGGLPESC